MTSYHNFDKDGMLYTQTQLQTDTLTHPHMDGDCIRIRNSITTIISISISLIATGFVTGSVMM